MALTGIDLAIVVIFYVVLLAIVISTKKLTRSVAGFLSGERCAGRYLLTIAQSMAFTSAIGIVAGWQSFYKNGLGGTWWILMGIPVSVGIAMSGWVTYRYRQTRALTMPQFLEMRYSRKFRIFAGMVAFLSCVLNCGIFPAVTARFIIYFVGIPEQFSLFGMMIPTFPAVMFVMVGTAVILAIAGGQIAIMVTDFFQGLVTNVACVLAFLFILQKFGWTTILDTLATAPEGHSMIHPFGQGKLPNFGPSFFIMMTVLRLYRQGVWQGNAGCLAAAKNPHEGRMANMLGEWRNCIIWILVLVPLAVWVIMHNNAYADMATQVNTTLTGIDDEYFRQQVLVPTGMKLIFPAGLMGLFLVMMIGASISTDDAAYHSWGSIFVQDVIMPFRKTALTPEQHLKYLRWSLVGVGTFAFCYSLFIRIPDYIYMYWGITEAFFTGGAGCAVVGGLYWSRGTTQGAWAGMITGGTMSLGALLLRFYWEKIEFLTRISEEAPNGMKLAMIALGAATVVYFVVSLLTCKKKYNMDKLLHRGEYAVDDDKVEAAEKGQEVSWIARKLGFTDEFTTWDKVIYIGQYTWIGFWGIIFVIGTAYNLINDVSDEAWKSWWKIQVSIFAAMAVLVTVWYAIGGTCNVIDLYKTLKSKEIDIHDDGTVQHDEQ